MPNLSHIWIRTSGYSGTEWIRADTLVRLRVIDGNLETQTAEAGGYSSGRFNVVGDVSIGGDRTASLFLAEDLSGKAEAFRTLRGLLKALTEAQKSLGESAEVAFGAEQGSGARRWLVTPLA